MQEKDLKDKVFSRVLISQDFLFPRRQMRAPLIRPPALNSELINIQNISFFIEK